MARRHDAPGGFTLRTLPRRPPAGDFVVKNRIVSQESTVFVPSDDTRLRLIARGWNPDRLALWRRGVDATVFSPTLRSAISQA